MTSEILIFVVLFLWIINGGMIAPDIEIEKGDKYLLRFILAMIIIGPLGIIIKILFFISDHTKKYFSCMDWIFIKLLMWLKYGRTEDE